MRTATPTRYLLAVLALMATLLVAVAMPSQAADSGREAQFLELINAERSARGLTKLAANTQLTSVARSWSDVMDRDTDLRHNPNLGGQVADSWTRLGENVGVGYGVSSLHEAFMDSSGHRANILGDYNQAGIGVTMDGSRIWVTVVFMKAAFSSNTVTPSSSDGYFTDVSGTHAPNIEKIRGAGISNGCGSRIYCPDDYVTRAQMATFMARALDIPASSHDRFSDVSGTHEGNVNAIAGAGISKGCGDGKYCPDAYVTRAQMATFLARALDL